MALYALNKISGDWYKGSDNLWVIENLFGKELISFIIARACATDKTLTMNGDYSGRASVT